MNFFKHFDKGSTYIKTDLGLTNTNYIVTENGVEYFVKEYSNHVINYEVANNILVHDYDVPTRMIDNEYKITLKLNIESFSEVGYTQSNLIKFASMLKKFHKKGIKSFNQFNPIIEFRKYISRIENILIDYSQFEEIVNTAKNQFLTSEKVFCHNDLVEGNIMFGNKVYLIDYEFSGMNDPLFDVASFLNENNLKGTTAEGVFLTWYFDDYNEDLKEKLDVWDKFHSLMWAAWANMMADLTGQEIYNVIFEDKIKRIK